MGPFMDGGARPPNRSFRVSPVDRLGRRISPVVLDAAEQIGRGSCGYRFSALASKKNCPQANVEDLPSYLYRAFIRRVDRIKKKQLAEVTDVPVLTFGSGNSTDPQAAVEMKILIDELLTRCDPLTREVFYRRVHGFSWEEIGRSYGISAHAAAS